MQDATIECISKQLVIAELDVPPSLVETVNTIGQLKGNKATDVDGIPPQAWINRGLKLHTNLYKLLISCWEQGVVPQDFHAAVIITLYKNMGGQIWLLQLL